MNNIRTNPDGYTLEGYIAPKEGFWDELRFTYRMATYAERVTYEEAQKAATGAKKSAVVCEAIARHLKTWNEVDEKGTPIRCTKDSVAMVKNPYLVDRLYNIITGWELSDSEARPEGDAAFDAATLIDSLSESVPPGVLLNERAEKN